MLPSACTTNKTPKDDGFLKLPMVSRAFSLVYEDGNLIIRALKGNGFKFRGQIHFRCLISKQVNLLNLLIYRFANDCTSVRYAINFFVGICFLNKAKLQAIGFFRFGCFDILFSRSEPVNLMNDRVFDIAPLRARKLSVLSDTFIIHFHLRRIHR